MKSHRLLLIDGDCVLYRAAFAAQAHKSVLKTEDGKEIRFNRKWAAKEWAELKGYENYTIDTVISKNDVGVAFYSADSIMKKIFQKCNSTSYRMFLTGEGNFRDKIAVTHGYKANRDKLDKPVHYDEVREYLIDKYGAEIVNGMEADDALGINQTNNSIIVTMDKDLDMIPGHHYNFVQDRLYDVDPFNADYVFYKQILTGDPVDNIKGLTRIGDKTADKILSECSYEEVWPTIYEYYKKEFGDNAYDRMVENGRLLWILRNYEEHWSPLPKEELCKKG